MAVLESVVYEFFEWEEPSDEVSTLHRQVRLGWVDGPVDFVSWTWKRQRESGPAYSIDIATVSFFSHDPPTVLDVSRSARWARHVGRETSIAFVASDEEEWAYQAIEVRSGEDVTYLCSIDTDTVLVMATPPFEACRTLDAVEARRHPE